MKQVNAGVMDAVLRAAGVQNAHYDANNRPIPYNKAVCDMLCAGMAQESGAKVGPNGELVFETVGDIGKGIIGFELDGHSGEEIKNAQVEAVVFQKKLGKVEWSVKGIPGKYREGHENLGKIDDVRFMATVRGKDGKVISEHVMTDWGTYVRRFKDGKPCRIEAIRNVADGVQYPHIEDVLRSPCLPHSEIERYELAKDGETVTRRSWLRPFIAAHADFEDGKVVRETVARHYVDGGEWPIFSEQNEYHPDGSKSVIVEERSVNSCQNQTPDKQVVTQIKANGEKTVTTKPRYGKPTVVCFDKNGKLVGEDVRLAKRKDSEERNQVAEAIKAARKEKASPLLVRLGVVKTGREKARAIAEDYHSKRSGLSGKTALKFKDGERS